MSLLTQAHWCLTPDRRSSNLPFTISRDAIPDTLQLDACSEQTRPAARLADNGGSACSQESAHHHWTGAHAHGYSTPVLHFSEFEFFSATTIALPFLPKQSPQRSVSGRTSANIERTECSDELAEAALEQGRHKWVLLTWHNAALVIILSLP